MNVLIVVLTAVVVFVLYPRVIRPILRAVRIVR